MLLKSIRFENFRALRDTTLPLGRVTLLIGPNGSGKSTALLALKLGSETPTFSPSSFRSLGNVAGRTAIRFEWDDGRTLDMESPASERGIINLFGHEVTLSEPEMWLKRGRVFSFDPSAIAQSSTLERRLQPQADGSGMATVLTSIRDRFPEHFEALTSEMRRWLPDFDRILLDTTDAPGEKRRAFMLRTSVGAHEVPASVLSEGTLLSLAMLTLAHLPEPPSIVGLEEPDRGVHPRLLRDVRDAVFRLAYPEASGVDRPAVQVVMTTHSPYFVDLFRDHPEDVVIAQKDGLWARFERLVDRPNADELLRDAHLGESASSSPTMR